MEEIIMLDGHFLVLRELAKGRLKTPKKLLKSCDISQETFCRHLINLTEAGYFKNGNLTTLGLKELEKYRVNNAIILAAGIGSRFVPLTYEMPKGLLSVKGERMIERQIKQLQKAGITDITVAVGYMKEKFSYLVAKYGVKLIYSPDYATKNNLSTLYHARKLLKNTYILSSDNYMTHNVFNVYEKLSWYSVVERSDPSGEWHVEIDKTGRIKKIKIGGDGGLIMMGPVFFNKEFSSRFAAMIERDYLRPDTDHYYWENTLFDNLDNLEIYAKLFSANVVNEFENLDELRKYDPTYKNNSNNKVMGFIAKTFNVEEGEIGGILPLKLGMTNESFLFEVKGNKYVCRIPGEGSKELIDRRTEYATYQIIAPHGFTDQIVIINPHNGFKITKYEQGARVADPASKSDLKSIMSLARWLHQSKLKVTHHFNLEESIRFYENLCIERNVILQENYIHVRKDMEDLFKILNNMDIPSVLCHIDLVCDNCLVLKNGEIRLIDWEYSGMCDPMVDIALFAIYSNFSEEQLEELLGYYFVGSNPTDFDRMRVFMYASLGGFLWYLWALYKQSLGLNIGDYALRMFRYAQDYPAKVNDMLNK